MNTVLDRIDAWQSTGLIDASTADRLRAAEASTTETTTSDEPSGNRARSAASVASSFFGPTPTIVEVFAYLGAGFFLGAWSAFVVRLAGAVTAFGAAILAYLEPMISPAPASIDFSQQQPADSILVRVVLPAIAWLVVAFAIGLVGLAEARSTDDLGRRRATVTRFWA